MHLDPRTVTCLGKSTALHGIALVDGDALGLNACDGWALVRAATDGGTLDSFKETKLGDVLGSLDGNSLGEINGAVISKTEGKTDSIALVDGDALGLNACNGCTLVNGATDGETLGSFEGTKLGDGSW